MEEIIVSSKVKGKLDSLAYILFKEDYFGFLKSAEKYVLDIIETLYLIPKLKHSKTVNPKIGTYFVRHKANSKTTYYIIFDKKDERYLVKDIISNHDQSYRNIISPKKL